MNELLNIAVISEHLGPVVQSRIRLTQAERQILIVPAYSQVIRIPLNLFPHVLIQVAFKRPLKITREGSL